MMKSTEDRTPVYPPLPSREAGELSAEGEPQRNGPSLKSVFGNQNELLNDPMAINKFLQSRAIIDATEVKPEMGCGKANGLKKIAELAYILRPVVYGTSTPKRKIEFVGSVG